MEKSYSVTSPTLKIAVFCFFLLTTGLQCANSARVLDEDTDNTAMVDETAPVVAPVASNSGTAPVGGVAPTAGPPVVAATSGASATVAGENHAPPPLTFFMHDIVGGSTASTRMVTGIVANNGANGQLPFSKPNGGVFPVNGGVPLVNGNNNNNNNNLPFATGLGNNPNTLIQNNGNNNIVNGGNRLPFVSGGQLPAGSSLQNLMFGSITVIDDELTEGHELGSSVVGKVQGFYLASSQDGSSQTMALTAVLHTSGGEAHDHDFDTISFFGIRRTAAPLSHVAIVGGTGKYENAKGYSTIETLHQDDQHATDGLETVLKISVYLTS